MIFKRNAEQHAIFFSYSEILMARKEVILSLLEEEALAQVYAGDGPDQISITTQMPEVLNELLEKLSGINNDEIKPKVLRTSSILQTISELHLLRKILFEEIESGHEMPSYIREAILEFIESKVRLAIKNKDGGCDKNFQGNSEFMNAVLDSLGDGIVACDAEGKLTLFNPASRKFHGLKEKQIPADEWADYYDLYLPDGRKMKKEEIPLFRALQEEEVLEQEMVIAPKKGNRRVLRATGRPLFDEAGRKLGAVVAMHDVTAEKEALQERIARESAEKSREQIENILESITDAFFSVDADWTVTHMNSAAVVITGRSRAEILGKNLWKEFPGAIGSVIEVELKRSLRERKVVTFEAFYPEDIQAWLEFTAYPSKDGLAVYYRNITERKRAEEEIKSLHGKERKLRIEAEKTAAELNVILSTHPDQIFIGNTETFVYVNKLTLEMMGFDSLEDLVSDLENFPKRIDLRDARTGVQLTIEDSPFRHALRGENVVRELTHVNIKTGEKKVIIAKAKPIYVDGAITGAVAIHTDITDTVRVAIGAQRLQEITATALKKTGRFQELLDEMAYTVCRVFQAEGSSISFHDKVRSLNGTSGKIKILSDIEKSPIILECNSAEDDHRWIMAGKMHFRDSSVGSVQVFYSQVTRPSEEDLSLLQAAADHIALIIDNLRLLENSKDYIKSLEAERELREKFVSTLTHDLRNPLAAAKMGAELIIRSPQDTSKHLKHAHKMLGQFARIENMIQDLLDTNRLRAGETLPVHPFNCHMDIVAKEVIEDLCSIHGDLFRLHVQGDLIGEWDGEALRRIMENLLVNAIKYGDTASPILIELAEAGNKVKLIIQNKIKGNPLSAEEIRTLFDPYKRSISAEKSGKKGWGIGLSLVKALVEAHNGYIEVSSSFESGTRFIVTFPKKQ